MNILALDYSNTFGADFLFAGGTKLVLPMETLQSMSPPNAIMFPGWFLKFIGLCEVLGALGLVLPGLLRRQQHLTVLAAIGLTILMIGAVVTTIMGPGVAWRFTVGRWTSLRGRRVWYRSKHGFGGT